LGQHVQPATRALPDGAPLGILATGVLRCHYATDPRF
jgi:hypothetical protein